VWGERRLLWADGRGLLPHGVGHLGWHPRGGEGRGEGDVRPMPRPAPPQRPPSGSPCPAAGPQRATGSLGGTVSGGPNEGVNGYTGLVVGCTSAHSCLHGSGQPAVVSRGQGQPRPCHTAGLLTSLHRALVLRFLTLLAYHGLATLPMGPGWRAAQRAGTPGMQACVVHPLPTCYSY